MPVIVGLTSLVEPPAPMAPVVGATSSLTLVMVTVWVGAVRSRTRLWLTETTPRLPAASAIRRLKA